MQINWSEQSQGDLQEILLYVAGSFGKKKTEEVLDEIRHSAQLLKDFPMLGNFFVEDTELQIVYRTLSSKLNQLVYFVDGETVNIVTVRQNRRDINRLKKASAKQ